MVDTTNAEELMKGGLDPLCGLPVMNRFFEIAQIRRDEYLAEGKKPVMVFFDFNGMKSFNMKYGFAEGDKLIIAMAEVLKEHFGEENCSRFSGDRFAVVTRELGLEEELKDLFEDCLHMNNGKNLPVRAGIYKHSIGNVGPGMACDRAKMACDVNRDSRVSCMAYFSVDMLKAVEKQRYIIDNFERAMKERYIQVYYQPLIRAANGRVCDEEALARWIDPEKGFMSPADFIPVLEEAKLIYKLDLYVTDRVLEKIKLQEEAGFYRVPCSVNISRADFESCDIVEEIRKRVDAAGIARELITIEVTESTIAADIDYMRMQVERFQSLGFKVWMDDYGSGYSSPLILQQIKFDTLKLDMGFLTKFNEGDGSRVILSSLVKMALGLGIDTVIEGVETAEQAEFLRIVGCTKLQGYHYCKPIPIEEIFRRYEFGAQIGFENPEESGYYSVIGKANLYELSMSADDRGDFEDYFDTMPMAIVEVSRTAFSIVRSNKPFSVFFNSNISGTRTFRNNTAAGFDMAFIKSVNRCAEDGRQIVMSMNSKNGKKLHILIRRIAINPVTGAKAMMVVILSMADENPQESTLSYDNVAKALSSDYLYLYYVDTRTERFVEYSPNEEHSDISVERKGDDFFAASRQDAEKIIFEPDRERFIKAFTKENVLDSIDEHGVFSITYRMLIEGKPVYVDLKALRMGKENRHIIIAVNNVEARMKQQEEIERMNEERIIYNRIAALSGNYLCFYTVDPENDYYMAYNSSGEYYELGLSKVGTDFFKDALADSKKAIYPEDLDMFTRSFTRTKVMRQIEKNGLYTLTYRLMMGDELRYVRLKAAMVNENGRKQLIVGINDIDDRMRKDQEYARNLSAARNRANLDELTGVKNKHAYVDVESQINEMIQEGNVTPFALIMLDVVGLKRVNDSQGTEAGDDHLKQGCGVVCDVFQHSPVYRVGGDEFIVVATGRDYDQIDVLMDDLMKRNKASISKGGVVVAGGMARYASELTVEDLFRRADEAMFKNKEELNKL